MSGARKELVIGGPGSGKTTLLAGRALEQRALSIDPVGALRRILVGHVTVLVVDTWDTETLPQVQRLIGAAWRDNRPVLLDVKDLLPSQRIAFTSHLGLWLRGAYREGHLIVDECNEVFPPQGADVDNGMMEFIRKSRNYDVQVTLSVHRPALANTNVKGLVDTFRVGRLVLPSDLEAAFKILSQRATTRNLVGPKLAALGPGEWYVFEAEAPG